MHHPFVKAEVNLLRLPLFALQTTNLRELDGFECRGSVTRDGHTQHYLWRVTRHTGRPFPGPLARAAHLAFLHILTEAGMPFANPVTWGWRDLCRRIGIAYSGRTVQHLKEAIRATHGVIVEGHGAVYSKAQTQWLALDEDHRHLYARLKFSRRRRLDGQAIEQNSLWLADWYLENLNALYTAPLDYELWKRLDRQTPIASRLYEYLLPNLYRPAPYLRINYPHLAHALPVRVERYYSDARRQIGPALELLADCHVIARAEWSKRKRSVAQLLLYRGTRLESPTASRAVTEVLLDGKTDEQVEVWQLRQRATPQKDLVTEFYRRWRGTVLTQPTPKELAIAQGIIAEHGAAKAKSLVPFVIQELKQHWPSAKAFGAIVAYLPQAAARYEVEQRRSRQRATERLASREQEQLAVREKQRRQQLETEWQPRWDALSRFEQDELQAAVLASRSWLRHIPSKLHLECLAELAKLRTEENGPAENGEPAIANGAQDAR